MNVVIDDHLLRDVLLEREPPWLRRARRGGALITTGSWYYRLCGALHDAEVAGSLSGPAAELPLELRLGVMERVVRLPSSIQLLSLRDVAWVAAGVGRRHGLNLLAAEALSAAMFFEAAIATGAGNLPPRLAAAATIGRTRVLVPPNQ